MLSCYFYCVRSVDTELDRHVDSPYMSEKQKKKSVDVPDSIEPLGSVSSDTAALICSLILDFSSSSQGVN